MARSRSIVELQKAQKSATESEPYDSIAQYANQPSTRCGDECVLAMPMSLLSSSSPMSQKMVA